MPTKKHDLRDTLSGKFRRRGEFNNKYARSTLAAGIANFYGKMVDGFEDVLEPFAEQMMEYAQANAPWSDRSGDARSGLTGDFEHEGENFIVSLYHTVDYGKWLEIRWGGKYAVILPTIETLGPEMMRELKDMMDEIEFYE